MKGDTFQTFTDKTDQPLTDRIVHDYADETVGLIIRKNVSEEKIF
jgi:hypothetical protein